MEPNSIITLLNGYGIQMILRNLLLKPYIRVSLNIHQHSFSLQLTIDIELPPIGQLADKILGSSQP